MWEMGFRVLNAVKRKGGNKEKLTFCFRTMKKKSVDIIKIGL